jgi:hypothetical protein
MIGQIFGDRIVLYEVEPYNRARRFAVKCKCGSIDNIKGNYLRTGRADRCCKCTQRQKYPPEREVGKRYGKVTVLRFDESATSRRKEQTYEVICDCGIKGMSLGSELRAGKLQQCRRCWRNMVGKKFGDWKVLVEVGVHPTRRELHYECECACGKRKVLSGPSLKDGKTNRCKSCKEKRRWTHGAGRKKIDTKQECHQQKPKKEKDLINENNIDKRLDQMQDTRRQKRINH